ncbi:MAG: hypothetical protein EPN74_08670 [Rhodanobacter sp.]|nr:MAG: hypothetical protein EPN74_08670 [Rhodanobacter sp.]
MRRFSKTFTGILLAVALAGAAHASKDDLDVTRLTSSLDQLANDPALGNYAQADQARARDAIDRLAQAGSRERAHDLYLAERRVDLAKATAQLQDARAKLIQLDREHDQILLANSQREARMARLQLERQRMQYQMAQEEAARLQQQGQAYSQAAQQALAEAEQAKKLAAAQSRVARSARREAALAAKAARAMRSELKSQRASDTGPAKPKKPADKHEGHR